MELRKICPTCQTPNSPTEMLCTRCFGDISGITPTPPPAVATADNVPTLRLLLADGRQIELRSGETAGRAGAGGELFREFAAVSRNHARLEYIHEGWQVSDLASTNGTFLEGNRLVPDTLTPLANGQEIRFGSAFRAVVRIG